MKLYFENKFYEAPAGHTPLTFCANCTLKHDTCYGCPWDIADMSQSKEITGITEEECDNYVKFPIPGHFYYSEHLGTWKKSDVKRSLIYCEGTPLYDEHDSHNEPAWLYGGVSITDYAANKHTAIKELKEKYHDEFYNDPYCKGIEDTCIFDQIGKELHSIFEYNKMHFGIEIPENVWNECIKHIQVFNLRAHNLIMSDYREVKDNSEYTPGKFYYRLPVNADMDDIISDIVYLPTDGRKFFISHFTGDFCTECITYNYYKRNCKNVITQIAISDYQYEIPKETVDKIVELENEVNIKIEDLIEPYIPKR